jgi:uncharacterized protein
VSVFVDTSALVAILAEDDPNHARAASIFGSLPRDSAPVTHSLVVGEAAVLCQARLGLDAVRELADALLPVIEIAWVDEPLYRRAMTALLAARRRRVSLADWTSFELMRERGLTHAFAFDAHFAEQGFELLTPA